MTLLLLLLLPAWACEDFGPCFDGVERFAGVTRGGEPFDEPLDGPREADLGGWMGLAADDEGWHVVLRAHASLEAVDANTWVVEVVGEEGGEPVREGVYARLPGAATLHRLTLPEAEGLGGLMDPEDAGEVEGSRAERQEAVVEAEPPVDAAWIHLVLPFAAWCAEDPAVCDARTLRLRAWSYVGGLDGELGDVFGCAEPDCTPLDSLLSDPVSWDADTDGVPSATELAWGADPASGDSDGDGLPDGLEGFADPDEDGLPAILDPDADDDGIPDGLEGSVDVDGDEKGNHVDVDADGDGRLDADEGVGDADCDGTRNLEDRVDDDGFCDTAFERPDIDDGPFDGGGDPLDPPAPGDYPACGCATGPGASGAPWLALALLGLRRRRR